MSGPRRPTLCKAEHTSRAREFCARGATSPDLAGRFGVPATRRLSGSASFGGDRKTSGGKGGKGGNLQSLGNSGLFDDGATWRKPAETGGNPPAETLLEKLFAILLSQPRGALQTAVHPMGETAKLPTGGSPRLFVPAWIRVKRSIGRGWRGDPMTPDRQRH